MDRERIGLAARVFQLGQQKPARCLAGFEVLLPLLRRGVWLGCLWNLPRLWWSAGWILVFCVSALFCLLSLLLSACERVVKNRWMAALRQGSVCSLADTVASFSLRDVPLAVRIASFFRVQLLVRMLCVFALPVGLTAAGAWFIDSEGGVSRNVFMGGSVCLLMVWLAACFFYIMAREPLRTATALLTDLHSFSQRKSSLARLDKDCFALAKCSFYWMTLPCGARFQAKALFAVNLSASVNPSARSAARRSRQEGRTSL